MDHPQSELKPPVAGLVRTFQEFIRLESSGGVLLLASAAVALVWANSPWEDSYERLWHTPVLVGFGDFVLRQSLQHWINDGLMVIFFFVVGLEIKREVLIGELSHIRQAALPMAAALGGMIVPASVYFAINKGTEAAAGWAIPMATDIAFALGALALLKSIPLGLKVFLTALAIVDDLGAVVVIAFFYTMDIQIPMLVSALAVLVSLILLNIAGIRNPVPYAVLGCVLWMLFLNSGVHATVAGVLLAMTIPHTSRMDSGQLQEFPGSQQSAAMALEDSCEKLLTPLHRLEHGLHPWVANFIMPVFALANAGVVVGNGLFSILLTPVSLGVAAGLVFGKQIGVMLFSWASIRSGLAVLPRSTLWIQMYGVAWLAGIGFTMSLFIATLAFGETPALDQAKVGILAGSLISGIVGWSILRWFA